MAAPGSAEPGDGAAAEVLEAAERQLVAGQPAACLAALAALPCVDRQALPARRLQALCRVQLAGSPSAAGSAAWWGLFGLEAGSASAADVRRQYRRLAPLVHPDKNPAAASPEAFKRLRAAADALLEAVGGGSRRQAKRARTAGGGSDVAGEEAGGLSSGEEEEQEDWAPDGAGFPWWEEWDMPASRGAAAAAAPADPARSSGGAGQQTQQAAGGNQQQQATEEAALAQLSLDELRAEVRRRQAGLLEPQVDGEGRRIPLPQLQAALRAARSLLAERTAAAAAQAALDSGGGFLP